MNHQRFSTKSHCGTELRSSLYTLTESSIRVLLFWEITFYSTKAKLSKFLQYHGMLYPKIKGTSPLLHDKTSGGRVPYPDISERMVQFKLNEQLFQDCFSSPFDFSFYTASLTNDRNQKILQCLPNEHEGLEKQREALGVFPSCTTWKRIFKAKKEGIALCSHSLPWSYYKDNTSAAEIQVEVLRFLKAEKQI